MPDNISVLDLYAEPLDVAVYIDDDFNPVAPEQATMIRYWKDSNSGFVILKRSPAPTAKSVRKTAGAPCKPGETAARSRCIPQSGLTSHLQRPSPSLPQEEPTQYNFHVEPPKPGANLEKWITQVANKNPYMEMVGKRLKELGVNAEGAGAGSTADKYRHPDGTWDEKRVREVHEPGINSFLNPKAKAKEGERPKFVFILGSPGSGKTTAGKPFISKMLPEYTLIDSDAIKGTIPEFEGWNNAVVYAEATTMLEQIQARAAAERHNILYDGTGRNTRHMEEIAKMLVKKGYDVHVVLVTTPIHESLYRSVTRFLDNPFGDRNPDKPPSRYVTPRFIVRDVDGRPVKTYEALKKIAGVKSGLKILNETNKAPQVIDRYER